MIVKIRYCDRCGQEMNSENTPIVHNSEVVMHKKHSGTSYKEPWEPIDLCTDCYTELNAWFVECKEVSNE